MSFPKVKGGFVGVPHRDRPWDRKPLDAWNIAPGPFEAWIAATKKGYGGTACAWEVRRRGEDEAVVSADVRLGDPGEDNNAQRAYVAGVLGVLERLPTGSSVLMCCNVEWIMNGISGGLDGWNAEGRLAKGNDAVYAWPVWKCILVQRARISTNSADFAGRGPETDKDSEIIARLQEQIRKVRPAKKQVG